MLNKQQARYMPARKVRSGKPYGSATNSQKVLLCFILFFNRVIITAHIIIIFIIVFL